MASQSNTDTTSQIDASVQNTKIKMVAINVNSLGANKRRLDLLEFITENNTDIALISETKLNNKHKPSFRNYSLVRTDRPNDARGGGTAILVHNRISYEIIKYPNARSNKIIEYTVIRINVHGNGTLLIFSIYATCNNKRSFLKELNTLFHEFKLHDTKVFYIIAGDLNARHACWGDHKTNERGAQLKSWIDAHAIQNKLAIYPATQPTFPSAGSFLDYCIADSRIDILDTISNKVVTVPYDSDHNAISFSIDSNSIFGGLLEPPTAEPRYNFKLTNWEKFSEHLINSHDYEIPDNRNLSIDEINNYIQLLENNITNAIEAVVPRHERPIKSGCLKYVNSKIKKLQKYKSRLISTLAKTDNNDKTQRLLIKTTTKFVNNSIALEFRRAETSYWEAKARSVNFRDPHMFFPKINRYYRYKDPPRVDDLHIDRNRNDLTTEQLLGPGPNTIVNDKYIITQPTNKLNIIGKYFESINSPRYTNYGTETKRLADENAERIKTKLQYNRTHSITHDNFSNTNKAQYPAQDPDKPKLFQSFLVVEVLLKKAKNKTSSGLDKIPMIVLKKLPRQLIIDYSIIFNNCLNHAYYPDRWKRAKVIPIKKKGKDPKDPSGYRPISLTSNVSKIFEKLIKIILMEHITKNKLIPDNQYGFKPRHSTVHAVHKFASDLNHYLGNGMLVGAALLDIEKAFDSVWLNGLIYILILLGFPEIVILLICAMLHGKSFVVWDGVHLSTLIFWILEGMQQGTVTAPLLFIIYNSKILNLFDLNTGNFTHSGAYADDAVVYVAGRSIPILQEKLEKLVNKIYRYYKEWNLTINGGKSETILFRKTVNEISPRTVPLIKTFKIVITDEISGTITDIPNKDLVKYLGVHFDYLIRMNKHHSIQLEKAKKAFRANSRIFYNRHLEPKAKIICYQLLIRPIIAYAAPIWWNTGPTVMEHYRKFERSCLRACLGMYRTAESDYKLRVDNTTIYNQANIPRFDLFTLMLTRNYFSSLYSIDNDALKALKVTNNTAVMRMAKSNYSPPELFTNLDRLGCIQDENNIPIIYHIQRHCARKAIWTDIANIPKEKWVYSTALSDKDRSNLDRLSEAYTWLQGDAKHMDEIRKRARRKKLVHR